MFFSLQTVVIVNTEQPVVLEITWRSNKWSVIRLHQWHSVTCGDMWWPRGSSDHSDMSHLMRLGRDDCQLWCWSDHIPLTRLPGEDRGHYLGYYHHHHCHCHLSLIRHKVMSKHVIFKIGPRLSQTQFGTIIMNKTLAPSLESNELFRNLSVHGLRRVLCHWNWLPGVLIQQHHLRVGWNIIMNAGLQPGAQHLSVTRATKAYLMKYNSIIHTSLSLNKSPLNTSHNNAEACLVMLCWSMATI